MLGGRACEEGHRFSDVAGFAEAAKRDEAALIVAAFAVCGVHFGIGGARLNQVRRDVLGAELLRKAAGEGLKRRLRHVVDRARCTDDAIRTSGADADDATASGKMRDGGLRREDGAADVNRKQRVDVLDREIGDGVVARNRGVVDEDVQPTKCCDRLVDRPLDGDGISAVGLDGHSLSAQLLDRRNHVLSAVGRALERNCDVRSLLGEGKRNGSADPAGGAGHQSALTSQIRHRQSFIQRSLH